MKRNIDTGNIGEQAAANFLINKSYKVLARNWHYGHLEIDIIAELPETIVFIEVKTRTGTYFQQPFQAVNKKKQQLIIKAANAYIEQHEIDLEARFDIISIVQTKNGFEIDHIEDAFYPLA